MNTRYLLLTPLLLLFLVLSSCSHRHDRAPSISGIVNRYAAVLDYEDCGFQVDDAEGWRPGALVLVIQMQGASIDNANTAQYGTILNYGGAGLYEFGRIAYVDGNTVWLEKALVNAYSLEGHVQLVLVPEYRNVSVDGALMPLPWNGRKGGVVAISASGKVTLNADIDASEAGFRGGLVHEQRRLVPNYEGDYVSNDPEKHSEKGEGIHAFGPDARTLGRGAPANGGGGGGNHNGGCGGGANGGCGGDGGYSYRHSRYSGDYRVAQGRGGHALELDRRRMSHLFMGGGGGAGHSNNNTGSNGGNGGGIVLIRASHLIGNGHAIRSRGADAPTSKYDGASGGGAGGTVALAVHRVSDGLTVDVSGGNGGDSYNDVERVDVGTGGGGGGGTVCLSGDGGIASGIGVDLNGGKNGKTIRGSDYGATPGCSGQISRNFTILQGTERCIGDELELNEKGDEEVEVDFTAVDISR